MFKPDRPIESIKEDKLGRSTFAKALAETFLSYKSKESIVIGLFGDWGTGKTSVINMCLEHVENLSKNESKENKPIIVEFNPWNFSDQSQLTTQFFKQLSISLQKPDHAANVIKAGKRLITYAKFIQPLEMIPTIGPAANKVSMLIKTIGLSMREWGDRKSKDLDSIRLELNRLLEAQPQKIIIVIDDIDRLNNTEIRQMFQLVKNLGDFPNTLYLVAFDKQVVIRALEEVQGGSGLEYLEKVVQVPFEIPLISKQEVETLLLEQLNELIRDIPEERWDNIYFGNIYHSGLKLFFVTIRDVNRYFNALRFSFPLVRNEVNPVDFVAITGLQVFLPEVYYGIRDNKDLFIGSSDIGFGVGGTEVEIAKKRCDGIIGEAPEIFHKPLKELLTRLFPRLQSIYENVSYAPEYLSEWRRQGRICSASNFDTYFRLAIPTGEISQTEIQAILSLGASSDDFGKALLRLSEEARITRFLERLEDYTREHIPEKHIEPIITALIDVGDNFPEDKSADTFLSNSMRVARICYQLRKRLSTEEDKFKVTRNAIQKSSSLYTIVNEVNHLGLEHGKHGSSSKQPEEERTVNATHLEELERLACEKIEAEVNSGHLPEHSKLGYILHVWLELDDKEKVMNSIRKVLETDEGLVNLITSSLGRSTSQYISDYVGRVGYTISLEVISKLVSIDEIEPRIRRISESDKLKKLDDKQRTAIKLFLDTYDGKVKSEE